MHRCYWCFLSYSIFSILCCFPPHVFAQNNPADTLEAWRQEWFAYESELQAWCAQNTPTAIATCMQTEMAKRGVSPAFFATLRQEALLIAVEAGIGSTVDTLLESGANPNYAGKDGRTPMAIALEKGYANIQRLLRASGAKLPSKSDLIRYIKNQLWIRGYGISNFDSTSDSQIVSAIKTYQAQAGLREDGIVSQALAEHLTSTATIRPYLNNSKKTTTNVFVSKHELRRRYGWDGGGFQGAMAQPKFLSSCSYGLDHKSNSNAHLKCQLAFGNLEIDGGVWILRDGLVIERGSIIKIQQQ